MSDYISREALKEAFGNADADVCESYPDGHCDWGFGRSNINAVIDGIPAADVEPVVRCRECRYYAASGATTSFCIHPGGMKFTSDSDYCSRGKRRDQSADVRNMKGENEYE